jgi:xanthine dehydrogenase accessory factor
MKMENIYLQVLNQNSVNSPIILATVTAASGSTPQKPGSSAIFGKSGLIAGTVGGGVVEGEIQKIAISALKSKESGNYTFNLANDISKTEEAICGGQISILVDANIENSLPVFEQLRHSLENRIPGVLITMVTRFTEKTVVINRYWIGGTSVPEIPGIFIDKLKPIVSEMQEGGLQGDYRQIEISEEGEEPSSLFLLELVMPLPSLVIAGAGHIGRALAHLGAMVGFVVTVVDNRKEYANLANIPDASHIIVNDIGEAMSTIRKGDDTYVVIVTRGHKDDAAALKSCLGSELAYTGMIGSRKKIAAMRNDFLEKGWATVEQLDRIYAPVGIDIMSQSVEEIAVSIAAQLILVRNSMKTGVRRPKSEEEAQASGRKPQAAR